MSKSNGHPIAIITSYDESYADIAEVTMPIFRAYADRHGYVLHGGAGKYHTDPKNLRDFGDRGKIDLFCQLYDEFEIVMWLDIDSVIMDHDLKIEYNFGYSDFVWTYDPNGPCSGFWIARCVPKVRNALLAVQRLAQERGKIMVAEHLGPPHKVTLQMEPRGASDQEIMTHLMNIPPFNQVFKSCCLPGKELGHCYHDYAYHGWAGLEEIGQYAPGDWIVTAPSYPHVKRLKILKTYVDSLSLPGIDLAQKIERQLLAEPKGWYSILKESKPVVTFDRNWAGPPEDRPRMYRTQSEKDTWHAIVVDNEYRLPDLHPEDIVIDIGAHIGSFAYLAYKKGSRSVYAFELEPDHIEAGRVNLQDIEDGVAYYHTAVVRGDALRAPHYYANGSWNHFGVVGQEVPSKSLDQIIQEVAPNGEAIRFLKIDCEGGEWPILYTSVLLGRVQEIAGEYHIIIPQGQGDEFDGISPESISPEGLRACLVNCGFETEFVPHGPTIGNFYAKRRKAFSGTDPLSEIYVEPIRKEKKTCPPIRNRKTTKTKPSKKNRNGKTPKKSVPTTKRKRRS